MNIKHITTEINILPDGRMRVNDAAAYLGLRPKTLAFMRTMNYGPKYFKLGYIFYFKDDLDAWIASGESQ